MVKAEIHILKEILDQPLILMYNTLQLDVHKLSPDTLSELPLS
jgi:hypothetical protein